MPARTSSLAACNIPSASHAVISLVRMLIRHTSPSASSALIETANPSAMWPSGEQVGDPRLGLLSDCVAHGISLGHGGSGAAPFPVHGAAHCWVINQAFRSVPSPSRITAS